MSLTTLDALRWAVPSNITGTYSISTSDGSIYCDTSGGAFTVILPAAVDVTGAGPGRVFWVILVAGTAALTLAPNGTNEIYGTNSSVSTTSNWSGWEIEATSSTQWKASGIVPGDTTGVVAGPYGGQSVVGTFSVDKFGRLTAASETAIAITIGAVSGTVPINKGGTGQVTAGSSFNALSPMNAAGDIIYGGTSGAGTRLGKTNNSILTMGLSNSTPAWLAIGATGTVLAGGSTGAIWLAFSSSNTASTLVSRDGSGNFSMAALTATAGTISGNLHLGQNLLFDSSNCGILRLVNSGWSWIRYELKRKAHRPPWRDKYGNRNFFCEDSRFPRWSKRIPVKCCR